MEDSVIHERYRALACASILQAVDDYLESDTMEDYDLYTWANNCSYFDYLNIDREYFYAKAVKLKQKGVKKIRRNFLNGKAYGEEL